MDIKRKCADGRWITFRWTWNVKLQAWIPEIVRDGRGK